MSKLRQKTIELCNSNYINFNDENFMMNSNDERFNTFLNDVILKYFKNKEDFYTHIIDYNNPSIWNHNGIKMEPNGELYATIPNRKTMLDEMNSIFTLTKLVRGLNDDDILVPNITDNVVSQFNIFEYLKRSYNEEFAKLYIQSLKSDAIMYSKKIYIEEKKELTPYIYAYMLLEQRYKDYNINELNRINAKSKNKALALKMHGYDI